MRINLGLRLRRPEQSDYATVLQILSVNPTIGPWRLNQRAQLKQKGIDVHHDYYPERHCPNCATKLYHHVAFDEPLLDICPIHFTKLKPNCPKCKKPWPRVNEVKTRCCSVCSPLYKTPSDESHIMPREHKGYQTLKTLSVTFNELKNNIRLFDAFGRSVPLVALWQSKEDIDCEYISLRHALNTNNSSKLLEKFCRWQTVKAENYMHLSLIEETKSYRRDKNCQRILMDSQGKRNDLKLYSKAIKDSLSVDYISYVRVLKKLSVLYPNISSYSYYDSFPPRWDFEHIINRIDDRMPALALFGWLMRVCQQYIPETHFGDTLQIGEYDLLIEDGRKKFKLSSSGQRQLKHNLQMTEFAVLFKEAKRIFSSGARSSSRRVFHSLGLNALLPGIDRSESIKFAQTAFVIQNELVFRLTVKDPLEHITPLNTNFHKKNISERRYSNQITILSSHQSRTKQAFAQVITALLPFNFEYRRDEPLPNLIHTALNQFASK